MNRALRASCVLAAAAICAALGGGCRAIAGLSDLQFQKESEGGAGGSASASGTGGPVESCQDGIDNDGDGAVDCADFEDCDPLFECVDPIPAGWTGYAWVRSVPFTGASDAPPPCPDGSAPQVLYADPAGPAECAPCGCAWQGAACSAPGLSCHFNNNDCSTLADYVIQAETADCAEVSPPADVGDSSCVLTDPAFLTSAGFCLSSAGKLINSLSWGLEIDVCVSPTGSGGCPDGGACVPRVDMNYPISACILQPGSVECPDAWAAQQIDAYEEANDTRECTACGCAGSPTCNADGKYEIFDVPLCEGRLHTEVSETMCTSVADLFDSTTGSALPTLATVTQPECTGGEPTGDLQVTGPHTICCR